MASRNIGSVRWMRSRSRWYIDLCHNGKRHHIYSFQGVTFKQQDYAEDVLTLIRGEISSGTFDVRKYKRGSQLTVKVYAEKWVDTLSLAPGTLKEYRMAVKNHIGPAFKTVDIRDVRHHHLMEFKAALLAELSPKTTFNVLSTLKTLLRYAWQNGDIAAVPPFPRSEYTRPVIRWLNDATQDKVIMAIPEADRYIFWFLKWYGVRPSEARALQKTDIHEDHVTISHTYSLNKLVPRTKTHRVRVLPRVHAFNDMLEAMPKRLGPFVFVRSWNGLPYGPKCLNRLWNEACDAVGVKINLYNGTKHSLGMNLLERGVDKAMVQKIFGHTRPDMTDRYCQYQTKEIRAALEKSAIKVLSTDGKPSTGKG